MTLIVFEALCLVVTGKLLSWYVGHVYLTGHNV
jgi:hypothetical protein